MNKVIVALSAGIMLLPVLLFSQGFKYSTLPSQSVPRSGTVTPSEIKKDYFPSLQTLEMPKPGGEEYSAELEKIKKEIHQKIAPVPENKGNLQRPNLKINFEGNRYPSGIPNDNHMAISNSGYIVSSVNTTIAVFDTTGNIVKTWSFDAFSDTLKIKAGKYDGRVIYDPDADRFIVVFLAGFADSTSNAIIGFSQSGNPTATWNLYKLSGVPLNDKTWSDFPMISITKDELFLTLNGIQNAMSWQAGFKRCYLWQINKSDGYNGNAIRNKLYTNIIYNNKPIRNLCPVRGGSGLKGPESYFVSNRNFDKSNDTFFVLRLAGEMNTPDTTISLNVITSSTQYGVSPDGLQPFHDTLQTNDCRILDAFIENNTIQIVGNSVYFPSGRSGIFHGIISNASTSPVIQLNLIGENKMDYGYPAIAYAGKSATDDDAVIIMNFTSDSTNTINSKKVYNYPGHSVLFYKNYLYSDTLIVHRGTSIIKMLSGGKDRWGDYSAAQMRYNHPGEIWVVATFGHAVSGSLGNVNAAGTWISQIFAPGNTAGIESNSNPVSSVNVYPNPVVNNDLFTIDFTIQDEDILSFCIYNMQGKLVRTLLRTKADEGKNRFSFNLGALSKGTYILKISGLEGDVLQRKLVVQ